MEKADGGWGGPQPMLPLNDSDRETVDSLSEVIDTLADDHRDPLIKNLADTIRRVERKYTGGAA